MRVTGLWEGLSSVRRRKSRARAVSGTRALEVADGGIGSSDF